ncbi:hypothetical protein EZV62_000597 [Acer yangbiense]|uniref:Bulb-type lectin domain-containing protein n=1 Tax=Acer yangbiense TaxID=1000413 RepID=A0A5C7ISD0_9ROSI|nr:hypothetical protein EZV62_000597 [Acer yangbiense]
MKNNGNLVLLDSSSKIIWQSFDSPTDTILLRQVLAMGQKLDSNANGTVDYSTEQYRLEVQMNGNVLLSAFRFADPAYWYTETVGNQSVSVIFNHSTTFMYVGTNTRILSSKLNTTDFIIGKFTPIEDYYHRATISDHGNLQQWCLAFALHLTIKESPASACVVIHHWIKKIPPKGCYPNVTVDFCDANSSASDPTIEEYNNTDIPSENFADMFSFQTTDVTECKKAVLDDCFCAAGVWSNSRCFKKRMPLLIAKVAVLLLIIWWLLLKFLRGFSLKLKDSPSWVVLLAAFLSCSVLALVFGITVVYNHPLTQPYIHGQPSAKPKSLHRVTEELHQVDEGTQIEDMILVDWVLCCVKAGNLRSIVSHDLEVLGDLRFETMTMIGLWCICSNPTLRPSMNKVIQMLEGTVEVGVPPEVVAQIS